jgi:hypothetical protein
MQGIRINLEENKILLANSGSTTNFIQNLNNNNNLNVIGVSPS